MYKRMCVINTTLNLLILMKQSDGEKRVETPKLYKNYITTKVVLTPNYS